MAVGASEENAAYTILEEGITTSEILVEEEGNNDLLHLEVRQTGQSRLYHCPACTHAASKLSNVRRHLAAVHQRLRYSCPDCGYSASKADRLRQHQIARHSGAESSVPQPTAVEREERKKRAEERKKRPPNAFLLFCRKNTDNVRQELERQSVTPLRPLDVSRALGHRWKELSSSEREEYQERYAALLAEYRCDSSPLADRQTSIKSDKASRERPPRTPFQVYTKAVYGDIRTELPAETTSQEIFRELGRRWRTLTRDQRQPYAAACHAAKLAAAVCPSQP